MWIVCNGRWLFAVSEAEALQPAASTLLAPRALQKTLVVCLLTPDLWPPVSFPLPWPNCYQLPKLPGQYWQVGRLVWYMVVIIMRCVCCNRRALGAFQDFLPFIYLHRLCCVFMLLTVKHLMCRRSKNYSKWGNCVTFVLDVAAICEQSLVVLIVIERMLTCFANFYQPQ